MVKMTVTIDVMDAHAEASSSEKRGNIPCGLGKTVPGISLFVAIEEKERPSGGTAS